MSSSSDNGNNKRAAFAGPEIGPESPFPLKLAGPVVRGFGRGSKELGIPTANIPISGLTVAGHDDLKSGVYFGWAGLSDLRNSDPDSVPASVPTPTASDGVNGNSSSSVDSLKHQQQTNDTGSTSLSASTTTTTTTTSTGKVYPMVMSLGYNPFYGNKARSVEVHVMHDFRGHDFYGAQLRLAILGFIRPELDYTTRDALVADINTDIAVARRSLERENWASHAADPWLLRFADGNSE